MSEHSQVRPDITLAVDGEGVIRSAVSGETLAAEPIEQWRGLRWTDTVPPGTAGQVNQAIEEARREGESSCFTVNQRLPSGRELLLEYTAVTLGKKAGFVAIGKSLQAISDLKSRLEFAQREREKDYWKLREIETRYRALLDASAEAVALVRVTNLRVVEANMAATKSLGLVPGAEFGPILNDTDRRALNAMLATTRMKGRAPSIVLHLSADAPWSFRASMLISEGGAFYLFQMAPLAGPEELRGSAAHGESDEFSIESFVQRMPDGFVVVDREGIVRKANDTFLDLVQADVESAALGQSVKRWLSRTGSGIRVIMNLVERHGMVRAMRTTIEGELGATTEVEISAVGDQVTRPLYFGLVIRDVMSRTRAREVGYPSSALIDKTLDGPLENVVRSTIEAIERERIVDALSHADGSRTMAAKSLGLSRQSLHAKLKKYRLQDH